MAESMKGLKRTRYCGEFTRADIGREVIACGWTQRTRDLGALVFIDLRDRSGIIQLAFDSKTLPEVFKKAAGVRAEYVLAAKGVVRQRETPNPKLATGDIEIAVSELRILAKSETPPFEITEDSGVRDELLLKYRYLDLRRPDMQRAIIARHRITGVAHDYFSRNGFIEIETPTLIKSTPEGARDYLVPSRVNPGKFYALPQSPQQYKQLLMLAGFDRYMQIARCYRDEDLRADRQPEFTQIDLEMSFVEQADVMEVNEGFIKELFKKVLGIDVATPFRRLDYTKAMAVYGSDKPDTRFDMTITDLTDTAKNCGFKVFESVANSGGCVRGIVAKGAYDVLTRKEIDKLTSFVKGCGVGGLAWSRFGAESTSSSFEKFLTPEAAGAMKAALGAQTGDVALIIADADVKLAAMTLGSLRCDLGAKLGLIPKDRFDFLWVTDFPLFEYSKEEGRFVAEHHPFTAPADEDVGRLLSDPGACRAKAYDMVLNGVELGGGSIRINDPELQAEMFKALGISDEVARKRFGFFIDAFRYGAPPHGGMAYGLDRLVMLMLGRDSIKDVIAFPKVQNASELMTSCPTDVDSAQLKELHIALDLPEKDK